MAAVKLSFTWLRFRKTLAPEQRTTAARAFHADRELLSASKLILDTKNTAYRAVAAVRSEASGYWRTVTLPFPEAGIRVLPKNSLGLFATTMQTNRERLQEAASELASQYDTMKSEAQRRLGTLFNANDYPTTLDGLFDLSVTYPSHRAAAVPRCPGPRGARNGADWIHRPAARPCGDDPTVTMRECLNGDRWIMPDTLRARPQTNAFTLDCDSGTTILPPHRKPG
jgi:hypothetical protein